MFYQMVAPMDIDNMDFYNESLHYKFFVPSYVNSDSISVLIGDEEWYSKGTLILTEV